MNKAGLAMLNIEDEQSVIGKSYLRSVSEQDRERVLTLLQEAYQGRFSEFEFVSNTGIEFSCNFVPIYDVNQKVNRLMGITQDVTEKNRTEKELNYQARYDPLTSLINRSEFERRVERLIASTRQTQSVHALCFMDLVNSKW
jgi:PleD family two-component response regulator